MTLKLPLEMQLLNWFNFESINHTTCIKNFFQGWGRGGGSVDDSRPSTSYSGTSI